jgi:hypothetical protein
MRGLLRCLLRGAFVAGFGAAVAVASPCEAQGSASQFPTINQPRSGTRPPAMPSIDGSEPSRDNPLAAIQQAQRTKAIANERQRKIVDDTAKLLQLATELKDAVAKTTKDQMSLEVIRKAEEIEKLARDVKQRMKS